jgi:hypothetical protein
MERYQANGLLKLSVNSLYIDSKAEVVELADTPS